MTRRIDAPAAWSALLSDAVSRPGVISAAYSRFWNYSIGNQLLALWQCAERKIDPGPINTFVRWRELDRTVRKGEKALTLCMPVKVKRKRDPWNVELALVRTGDGAERQVTGSGGVVPDESGTVMVTVFTYKANWFVLSQTDGKPYEPQELPTWSESLGLPGSEFSRGYLQHWLKSDVINDRSAQRIFKAADTILRAGRPQQVGGEA